MSEGSAQAGETVAQGALARKAAIGRARRPEPVAMTPQRALALALGRVADTQMGLQVRVLETRPRALSLAEIPETIMEQPLIAVMEGPGEGLGLIAICPTLVASLIEIQTVGRLSQRPVVARRPTRTDAAMAAVFLDAVMEGFEQLMSGVDGQGWVAGYRYASYLDDPRPLGLMLEDMAYRGFAMELSLGGEGQRQGKMVLALPATAQVADETDAEADNPARQAAAAQAAEEAREWSRQLEQGVMSAELCLTGVLDRMRLPLSDIMSWTEGTMLPLHEDALVAIGIEVAGAPGKPVMRARLGQNRGARALRLLGSGDQEAAASEAGAGAAPVAAAGLGLAVSAPPAPPPVAEPPTPEPLAPDLPEAMTAAPLALDGLDLGGAPAEENEEDAAPGDDGGLAPLPMSLAIGGEEDSPDAEDELEPLPMKIGAFG